MAADDVRHGPELINPWGVAMFRTLQTIEPVKASEQAAYGKWLDQQSDRQSARSDRTHGAEGVIPVRSGSCCSSRRGSSSSSCSSSPTAASGPSSQATMMGGVAVVISSTLLLLWFLDNPYHIGVGGLRPTAMERTLELLDVAARAVGLQLGPPATSGGSRTDLGAVRNRGATPTITTTLTVSQTTIVTVGDTTGGSPSAATISGT